MKTNTMLSSESLNDRDGNDIDLENDTPAGVQHTYDKKKHSVSFTSDLQTAQEQNALSDSFKLDAMKKTTTSPGVEKSDKLRSLKTAEFS
jgi:hypothetical protein